MTSMRVRNASENWAIFARPYLIGECQSTVHESREQPRHLPLLQAPAFTLHDSLQPRLERPREELLLHLAQHSIEQSVVSAVFGEASIPSRRITDHIEHD